MLLTLESLSNEELVDRLVKLVRNEKTTTQGIVMHLAEVNRRRLFLALGYSSLFDYATRGLGYSRSAAMRRIKVAKAGTIVPKVFKYLENGEVSLSTVELCSALLEGKDGAAVLESLRGKTIEQAERIAANRNALTPWDLRDRIKTVVLSSPAPYEAEDFSSEDMEGESYSRSGTNHENDRGIGYQITFTVSEKFMELLKDTQELVFTGDKEDLKLENVFSKALEEFVERHSPKERLARRRARKERRRERQEKVEAKQAENQCNSSTNQEVTEPFQAIERSQITLSNSFSPEPKRAVNPRYIPRWLREEVLERDGYQCTFKSDQGVRCQCRFDLEIDHIQPFACGGHTTKENLRVLCSLHNLHMAKFVYGDKFIEEKINRML